MWACAAEPKHALKRGVAEALGRAASAGVPIHMVARIQTQYAVRCSTAVCKQCLQQDRAHHHDVWRRHRLPCLTRPVCA